MALTESCELFLLLFLYMVAGLHGQQMLSDFKKCGDLECEKLLSRVQATRNYAGTDCRFLNFKNGDVISVYQKLSGKREDLWAGSLGTQFGYFPRDAVEIEEVYVSKELELPVKETDFFCVNGDEYVIESDYHSMESDMYEGLESVKAYMDETKTPETSGSEDMRIITMTDPEKTEAGGDRHKENRAGIYEVVQTVTEDNKIGSDETENNSVLFTEKDERSGKLSKQEHGHSDITPNVPEYNIPEKGTNATSQEEKHIPFIDTSQDRVTLPSDATLKLQLKDNGTTIYNDNSASFSEEHQNAYEATSIAVSVLTTLEPFIIKIMEAIPEYTRPNSDLYGLPLEMVIFTAVIGIFTVLLFLWRTCKAVRSRLYLEREKELSKKIADLLEEKCTVLEKLSIYQQKYEELESSLKNDCFLREITETSAVEVTFSELERLNAALNDEIDCLKEKLETLRSKRIQQSDFIEDQRNLHSLETEADNLKTQIEEAQTTLKVYKINSERLHASLQTAKEENSHLKESKEQLFQETEGWAERCNELAEQIKMTEISRKSMEEALSNKESQVMSLTETLLKMKDWGSEIDEDNNFEEENNWETEIKSETENGDHIDKQQTQKVRKLIYAAKLNAGLKSLEEERNQVYAKLSDEIKAKEELAERIEKLENTKRSLRSESAYFESEFQKLQQKLKVLTEVYQESEMRLQRKLTVEESERLEKEEKLSKADEQINLATEELNYHRERAKDLEEELEKTIHSYNNQIISHEKKAHDNWLAARAAERELVDVRRENANLRQKLIEGKFKLEMLEKDPYALDVPSRPIFRERSPYGPSPLGQPIAEIRAFVSPPTLVEGPPRLSPLFQGGPGGRASRGAINNLDNEVPSESGELSSDRMSDHHGALSDSGSLSPTWERERKNMAPPPGHTYPEPPIPYRRSERSCHAPTASGRLSGPAELHSYSFSHSYDKTDGISSMENSTENMNSTENESKDGIGDLGYSAGEKRISSGFTPLVKGPLLPLDPRSHTLRRGPPVLIPGGTYGPPEFYPPRSLSGPPPHLLGMRSPFPPRPFASFVPPPADGSAKVHPLSTSQVSEPPPSTLQSKEPPLC
nr:PREDICTED: cTAGE family member 5 isoform X1 [Latimeria chalumnae]|eukprot:XP_014340067.1 PREDICTED: cTAGE family member 5 isoform X1 [Latimeria chalumnae]